ncbi:MAG: hypothetical protein GY898_06485 [Proteobacteria bacterium]|nr:hypothetical protein [Pseudomonadota bacterium]
MRRTPLLLLALLVPASAATEPLDIDLDNVGKRWLGAQYIDSLGWAAAAPGDLNGDGYSDFVVSSPQDEGPVTFDSILRVYFGSADGAPQSGVADWSSVDVSDGKVGGDSVFEFAFIPDATGDGVGDFLVAEPNASKAGKVLLYAGQGDDWPALMGAPDSVARWDGFLQDETDLLAPETRPSAVAGGDLDGDGLADIIIASAFFQRIFIDYSDAPFGDVTSLSTLEIIGRCGDEVPGSRFGAAMAVGHFNSDDRADLAVSAPGCEDDEGRVFVWYGSAAGLAAEPDLTIGGGDRLGGALNVLDLNGDGFDDLLIQELLSTADGDPGQEGRGNLWIHFGDTNGLEAVPDGTILGGFSDSRFGETVALMADTSNPADGFPELVVGSPEAAIGGVGQGAVYIFDGRADWSGELSSSDAHYRMVGAHRDAWFGNSLAATEDFDGDGFPELIIGEPNFTDGDSENDFHRGRFYLFASLPDRDEDDDGISTLNGDCDDSNADVSPLAFEDCSDDIDNDCDNEVNEGCGDDDDAADDDDTADPPGDDDDDDDDGCSCNSSVAAGPNVRAAAGLGGLLLLGLVGYRRSRTN